MNKKKNRDMQSIICRKFNLKTIAPTFIGTVGRYISPFPLIGRDLPFSIITFTVYPDLARLWYACLRKTESDEIPIVIVDSCGSVKKKYFPGAVICRFINKYHSWKATRFIRKWILSKYVWMIDDDQFVIDKHAISFVRESLESGAAAVSLLPRRSWSFEINGKKYSPLGSFSVAFNREIIEKEKLSLEPAPDNPHRPGFGYDTVDFANQQLIERGYSLVTKSDHNWTVGYFGTSYGRIYTSELNVDKLEEIACNRYGLQQRIWHSMVLGLYTVQIIGTLYECIFNDKPELRPRISAARLRELAAQNRSASSQGITQILGRMDQCDNIAEKIRSFIVSR